MSDSGNGPRIADGWAILIFALYLVACGLGPGCNFKGPGLKFQVDGQDHYFKLGHKEK